MKIVNYQPHCGEDALANPTGFIAFDIDDIPDEDADAQERNADGLKMAVVTEPIPGVPGVTWQRTKVLWETKAGAPWVHHECSPEPAPDKEAHPALVKQANAILAVAQKAAETRVVGRKPDANVVRTASGRKSRSRRAAISNEQALDLIRHHHGDALDVLRAAGAITTTQHAVGQALQWDIHETDRNALLLTKSPRAGEGDMRTFVSGDGTNTGLFEEDGELVFERDYGSTGTPEIRELDASPERRRLDAAFRAVQARLQPVAPGWAMVSAPQAPGPRWRILTGTNGTVARRLPHPAHVWPNLGTPMLPLMPTTHPVRRWPAPWECTRHVWRWLCGAVTSTANGARWVLRREVAWLRDWLDALAPIYAPIVTGSTRQETNYITGKERVGTKCTARGIRGARSPTLFFTPDLQTSAPSIGGIHAIRSS
jgi:hypothetical protein